jgi:hypothetical protein
MRAQAVLDDHRELVGEGRVVGDAVGDGGGQQMAVAVLVLQALAVERGAPGGGAEQEAPRALSRRPPRSRSPTRWKPNIE